jgi:hypothetical protein
VIFVFIVYSAPADLPLHLHIGKGKSLITCGFIAVHDSAGTNVAYRGVEKSVSEIQQGGNSDVGDPILDNAALLCAFDVSAPHQTGEMLRDSPL